MRRFRALIRAAVLLTAAGAMGPSPASAQEVRDEASRPPQYRVAADAVLVDVHVTERNGGAVPGLTAGDFLVLDDDHPQKVIFLGGEARLPLAVTLLIDRSASMNGSKLEAARAAALAFLDTLRPGDLVEILAFNDRAVRLFPLGPDHDAARLSLSALTGRGRTGLFEAVLVGLRDLEHGQRDQPIDYRQALVILSDGEDTKSVVAFDDVLDDVRRGGVIVYGISFRTDERDRLLAPSRELSQLAFDSGGRAMAAGTSAALEAMYREIGVELRSLYRVGFVPSDPGRDGEWRSISVRVPGKDVRVRARSGYYAPRTGTR